jgi:cytochrome P450
MTAFVPPFPPRPGQPLPVFELLRRSRRNLLTMFDDRAFEQQLMSIRILSRQIFICNSPDTVRHALVAANDAFERKSPQMRHALKPLLGDGLFISDGETWRTRRRIIVPAVHGSRMPDFAPLMVEAALETSAQWAQVAQVDVLAEMAHLTAEIICRAIFGQVLGRTAAHEIVDGFREYQNAIGQLDLLSLIGLPEWLPRPQLPAVRRSVRRIASTLDRLIAEYRSRADTAADGLADEPCVLRMLLEATDEHGAPLDAAALRNEVAVIFMAGHETTANTLAWAWYLLSQAPEVEALLHAELDRVLGGRLPALADLVTLPYTRAVIDETLRLYPPVPLLVREAGRDEVLRRRPVPAGSLVMVVPWLLHRHRLLWELPDHFMPERFLPGRAVHDRFAYVPFSVGPRVCAGLTFGLTEAVLCLATLAQAHRLVLAPGAVIAPVCRLTLRPGDTVPMQVALRQPGWQAHHGSKRTGDGEPGAALPGVAAG